MIVGMHSRDFCHGLLGRLVRFTTEPPRRRGLARFRPEPTLDATGTNADTTEISCAAMVPVGFPSVQAGVSISAQPNLPHNAGSSNMAWWHLTAKRFGARRLGQDRLGALGAAMAKKTAWPL